ncbi:MAG: redoxin domain-containing protein [Planctomycetota bacterium]
MPYRISLLVLVLVVVGGLVAAFAVADDEAPAVPAAPATGVEVGNIASDFTLKDQSGSDVRLNDLRGKIVVLEWFNSECPIVQRHYKAGTMTTLAKEWADKNVVWVAINSTHTFNIEKNKAAAEKWGIARLLDDHDGAVGHLYKATRTPEMVIIDADGKIRYRGAIDSDRFGRDEKPTNYVRQALEELAAGKEVSVQSATPYGCSVKYRAER